LCSPLGIHQVEVYQVCVRVGAFELEALVHCPFCKNPDSRVIDSRTADDGIAIRRRRTCTECGRRFTTQEAVILMVSKRSGVTEPFTRDKIIRGVRRACQGRPVDDDQLAILAQRAEDTIRARGCAEIASHEVGLAILGPLRELDEVAYLRFASVYRGFESLADFEHEIAMLRVAHGVAARHEPAAADQRAGAGRLAGGYGHLEGHLIGDRGHQRGTAAALAGALPASAAVVGATVTGDTAAGAAIPGASGSGTAGPGAAGSGASGSGASGSGASGSGAAGSGAAGSGVASVRAVPARGGSASGETGSVAAAAATGAAADYPVATGTTAGDVTADGTTTDEVAADDSVADRATGGTAASSVTRRKLVGALAPGR
jgi:transcriptional repressor NrdR